MTKEELQGFFKEAESDKICFEGSCQDCKKPVSMKVDLGEDGAVATSGGAIYFAGASEKKLYLKCDKCFNMDSTLRNYQPCLCYSRIVGYLTPMSSWHDGKIAEKNQRVDFKVDPEQLNPEYKIHNELLIS